MVALAGLRTLGFGEGRPAGACAAVGACAVVGTQGLVALAGLRTLGFEKGRPAGACAAVGVRPCPRFQSPAGARPTERPFSAERPFYPCVVRGKVLCLYGCAPWLVAWRLDKPQRGDPFQSPGCVALQGDQTLGSPVSIITKPCRGDPQEYMCCRSLWVASRLSSLGAKSLGWVITIFTTFDRHILRLVPS